MKAPKVSLDNVRTRIRRAQLVIGLGFVATVVGAILVSDLIWKLPVPQSRLGQLLVLETVRGVWVWLVLPLLAYPLARAIRLDPLGTALGSAATGLLLRLLLMMVQAGSDEVLQAWDMLLVMVMVVVAGVALTRFSIRKATADTDRAQQKAKAAASNQKDQYAEFAREAERLASLHEAREARTTAGTPSVAQGGDPVSVPAAASPAGAAEGAAAPTAPAEAARTEPVPVPPVKSPESA